MNRKTVIALITVAALYILTIICFDIIYAINDDVMIENVLSGVFSGTPSAMTYYFGLPVGSLLSLLYTLFPAVRWLGVFFVIVYLAGLYVIFKRLTAITESTVGTAYLFCAGILVYAAVLLQSVVMLHYTVLAAFAGAVALFMLVTGREYDTAADTFKGNASALIFMVLCFIIRKNVFFMLLPFLAVAGGYRLLKGGYVKGRLKKYIPLLLALAAVTGILSAVEAAVYGSSEYRQYKEYNECRTDVYDYVLIWDNEEARSYYRSHGITDEETDLYLSYNIMLTDGACDKLKVFASYGDVLRGNESFPLRVKKAAYDYIMCITDNQKCVPYIYLVLALYILVLLMCIKYARWRNVAQLAVLWIIRSAEWMYLIYKGRFPERITTSLMIIEILLLLGFMADMAKEEKKFSLTGILRPAVLIILIIIAMMNVEHTQKTYLQQTTVNKSDDMVYSYMDKHPENQYFVDVFATVDYTVPALKYGGGMSSNNCILGGWMQTHPLLDDRMAALGYRDVRDAIINADNARIVLRANDRYTIEDYENWLGTDFESEDEVGEFLIYKRRSSGE